MTKVDGTYAQVAQLPEYHGERTGKSVGFERKIRTSVEPVSGDAGTGRRHV